MDREWSVNERERSVKGGFRAWKEVLERERRNPKKWTISVQFGFIMITVNLNNRGADFGSVSQGNLSFELLLPGNGQ